MSNNKKNRTDGVIKSSNISFPSSMKSYNTTTSDYTYTRGDNAKKTETPNLKY